MAWGPPNLRQMLNIWAVWWIENKIGFSSEYHRVSCVVAYSRWHSIALRWVSYEDLYKPLTIYLARRSQWMLSLYAGQQEFYITALETLMAPSRPHPCPLVSSSVWRWPAVQRQRHCKLYTVYHTSSAGCRYRLLPSMHPPHYSTKSFTLQR